MDYYTYIEKYKVRLLNGRYALFINREIQYDADVNSLHIDLKNQCYSNYNCIMLILWDLTSCFVYERPIAKNSSNTLKVKIKEYSSFHMLRLMNL